MKLFVGLDPSLEKAANCVIGEHGKTVREAQAAREPEALARWIGDLDGTIAVVGLEAGPLSQWLHRRLSEAGLSVVLMETRQVKGALKAMLIKTDRRDAEGIARLLHLGWVPPVPCKSVWTRGIARSAECSQSRAAGLYHSGAVIAWIAAELRAEGRRDLPRQVRAPYPRADCRELDAVRRDRADAAGAGIPSTGACRIGTPGPSVGARRSCLSPPDVDAGRGRGRGADLPFRS